MRRQLSAAVSSWALASLLFGTAGAGAQESHGFAVQGFEPAPPGDRFFGVSDARVHGWLDGHAALVGNLALRPLRGYTLANGAEFITTELWVHAGLGISGAEVAMLSVDVPIDLIERGDPGYATEPESGKLGDIRATLRGALVRDYWNKWSLGAEFRLYLPTGDQDALVGDGQPRAAPQLGFSGELRNVVWAVSAGYLFRKHEDVLLGEVGAAITFGGGAGLLLLGKHLQLGVELYGHSVTETQLFSDRGTLIEALIGSKLRVRNLVIGAAIGRGFTEAPGSAAFRALLSLGLGRDELRDRDGDKIADVEDACPRQPGLADADPKKNGCPAS